jgi:hypothetical protein
MGRNGPFTNRAARRTTERPSIEVTIIPLAPDFQGQTGLVAEETAGLWRVNVG